MCNTTQRILVNGHGYQQFVDAFLKPFFQAKVEASSQDIQSWNIKLIEKLGPRTVKRSNVKFKGGMSFPCNQCDYSFKSISTLKNHKTFQHTLGLNASLSRSEHLQSTRNNSVIETLMLEDESITNLSNDAIGETLQMMMLLI